MRKGWSLVLLIVIAAVAVPVVAVRTGGGGWLTEKLLEMHGRGAGLHRGVTHPADSTGDVALPFELVTGHIVLAVSVNGSNPLSFILDTGDKYGIIDVDRARELNLTLGGNIPIHGVGPQSTPGSLVKDATFGVAGLPGFSQNVTLAMPLKGLSAKLGHDVDGIIGADFLSEFIVELDYDARVVTLHNKQAFTYRGSGDTLPIRLNPSGHPIVHGSVTPVGGEPIAAEFAFDAGSGGTLALNSPFLVAHHLPAPALPTVKAIGHGGTGGSAAGRIGRVSALTIGRFTLHDLPALFSEDTAGAFAESDDQGNIGQKIIGRFRVFLDYARSRIILEPTAAIDDPFEPASAGLRIETAGADYRTFRVIDLLESSPASEAGLRRDDVITAIDARPASGLTLTTVLELFERPVARTLTIRRGTQALTVTLKPRKLI